MLSCWCWSFYVVLIDSQMDMEMIHNCTANTLMTILVDTFEKYIVAFFGTCAYGNCLIKNQVVFQQCLSCKFPVDHDVISQRMMGFLREVFFLDFHVSLDIQTLYWESIWTLRQHNLRRCMFGCLGDQLAHTTWVMASQSMELIPSQCYVFFWIWSNLPTAMAC